MQHPTGAAAPAAGTRLDATVGLIDRIVLWVLCLGAFSLPLVYLRDTHDDFVLPKLLFAQLLVVTLFALVALRWAAAGALVIRRTPLDLPILAFLGSALVATIFSVSRNVALFGTYIRYEGLLTLATYAALYWLAAQIAWRSDLARIVLRAMLAGAYLIAIIAVAQWVIAALTLAPDTNPDFSYAGLPRASATMSNPTMLGAFLAMLLPVAAAEFLEARSLATRILAANVAFMMGVALALTFVRSAWLGALAGLIIVVAAPQRTRLRVRLGLAGAGLCVVLAIAAGGAVARGGLPLLPTLLQRVASIGVNSGSTHERLQVWGGTIRLVASRPVTGYGPDTFGMVYPTFRGAAGPGSIIDKAHSEILQIAATQGLLGVAAYLWMLAALGLAFWRGRRNQGAAAALGGLAGYQLWAQANFSWVPAAVSYWIFLALAVAIWGGELPAASLVRLPRRLGLAVALVLGLGMLGGAASGVARAWSAEVHYEVAIRAESYGDLNTARTALAQARSLGPEQSAYALEAGRVAMNWTALGDARWPAAREAFADAARLGTYYSLVYYDLALCDLHLGRRAEAITALGQALELSPGDPASLALLRQINGA